MKPLKEIKVHLRIFDNMLGSLPNDKEIYSNFVASKCDDAITREEEINYIGIDDYTDKGTTVFAKDEKKPFIKPYVLKGYFKEVAGFLKAIPDYESYKFTAHKKKIDGLVFVEEDMIFFQDIPDDWEPGICERPLKAQTAQGDRVALARSEVVQAGASLYFTIQLLDSKLEKLVREWLDYGVFKGLGQWRNSGKGRFCWEEIGADGNPIKGTGTMDEFGRRLRANNCNG